MKKKILVVDNSKAMLDTMRGILEKQGHEVHTAIDGLSALELLETFLPDIIFIDLVMPNIGGDKLCRILRAMPKFDTVFLVLVSAMLREQSAHCSEFGADACLVKGPLQEMTQYIAEVINQSNRQTPPSHTSTILGKETVYPREATSDLLSRKRHFEITLAHLADGFFEFTSSRKIVYTNPAAVSLFRVPEERLLSSDILTLFDGEARTTVARALDQLQKVPVTIGEEESLLVNGRHVLITLIPVFEQDSASTIAIVHDITARKKAEETIRRYNEELEFRVQERTVELQELQKELVETAHQAGMADIATGILHNVGNVITSTLASSLMMEKKLDRSALKNLTMANDLFRDKNYDEFLADHKQVIQLLAYYLSVENKLAKDVDDYRQTIDKIVMGINTIQEVIDSQQQYAKGTFFIETVDLREIIEDALTIQGNSLKNFNIEVVKELQEIEPLPVQKSKLIHIVINLLKNAAEAMEETPPEQRKITISLTKGAGYATLKVADTGCGIRPEHLTEIFSFGYTLKKKGHGFGLHNSANYMAEMSGSIKAESAGENQGATFTLQLPLKGTSEER